METRKRVLGTEHPDTLTGMANLAVTYHSHGRLRESKELGVQVVHLSKGVLGAGHPDTLLWMNNLAYVYQDLERLNKATWNEDSS
jgi:hypothetical protein